jgi:phage replication-related protein YjqB (UPF0714/DUF867 family)
VTTANRRTILALVALAVPSVRALTSDAAPAPDRYPSNTALYADPDLAEGVDYARRYRRHEMFDDSISQRYAFPKTAIVAPHGGGIEVGTSELCLAVAGYHPASLAMTAPAYDYWMFEGLRPSDNDELHVTSTHCDDPVARSLCGGSLNALGLHGCTPSQAGLPQDAQAALVGGRDGAFKRYLLEELAGKGFQAVDAAGRGSLDGDEPDNIANRTLLRMGGQLEITTPLRAAMFGVNTRPQRKNTTTQVFWDFVAGTRSALARLES